MWNQIQFTEGIKGRSVCPICSHHRKSHHQKQKCLSWDKSTGIATCHHCGEKIFKKTEKDYQYKAPKVEVLPPTYLAEPVTESIDPNNGLFKTIASRYGLEATANAFRLYKTFTEAENVYFHQADSRGIRYVKRVKYLANGKRNKELGGIRALTTSKDGNFKQCLFGMHLYDPSKYTHIVESEKTAIICHLEMPDRVWMATGGANNLNNIKAVREAILHPDLDKVNEWSDWAERNGYKVDRTIEKLELPDNSDLADAILMN